jgi:hypothetical protein
MMKREYRIAGVRAVSKRIVEVPLTKSYKILGVRYEVVTVVTRHVMLAGQRDNLDPIQPIIHYYTYTKSQKKDEWYGFLNGIVVKLEAAQLTPIFAENAQVVVLSKVP